MEISLGNTVPLFAHDVALSTLTKNVKSKKGKINKEVYTELVFIDSVRKCAIARIILPKNTLKELPKIINENIKKIKEDAKKLDNSKETKTEIKTNGSYLG